MKFSAYLKSLLPGFEKDRVLEDARLTRAELKEITIPAYHQATGLFKGWTFKSKVLQDEFKAFSRIVSGQTRDPILCIHDGLAVALTNLEIIDELVAKVYNEEVATAGFTYLKANLLQFVEATAFVSKYARKFLIYVYVLESAEYEGNSLDIADSLSKAELQWIQDHFVNFCTAFNAVTQPKAKTEKAFEEIPDIVITGDNEDSLIRTVGEKKIDPLQMRLIPIWLNPIYHVGMFIAEWQANRYKAAKDELRMLQLRQLHLERLKQGKPDAKIEKEIAYLESRIQGLNYKIAKLEEGK